MPELVNEDIRRLLAVGRHRAIQTEDPPAAVCARVGDDLDELVGRKLRNVAKRAILKRQNVSLGAECVVACAQRRRSMNSSRGPRDPGLFSSRTQRPHVEISSPLLVWRGREQNLEQPARVLLELTSLGGRVAVAQDQEVNFVSRIAALVYFDQGAWRRGL